MNTKKSLFNKSIIKSDIRRFWWISALYILIEATLVLPKAIEPYNLDSDVYTKAATGFYYVSDNGVLAFIFAFFTAGLLFSYLHKGSAVSGMHGVPVTRKQQYFSHLFSGMLLLVTPVIISSLVILAESSYYGANNLFALKYLYTCLVYILITFATTLFAVMISGNTIASFVFSAGFIVLPAYLLSIIDNINSTFLFGYSYSLTEVIAKIYLCGINHIWSLKSIAYLLIAALLYFVSYVLYKIRRLENYDEFVVFKYIKPIFMYVVSICMGLFGMLVINSVLNTQSIFLTLLPFGIASIIATNMFNRKSISLAGSLKYIIIYVAFAAAFKLSYTYDLTGFEKRVPDESAIESVGVLNSQYASNPGIIYARDNHKSIDYVDLYPYRQFTSAEDIAYVSALHKAITETKDMPEAKGALALDFEYHLKNGAVMKRFYNIDAIYFKNVVSPIVQSSVFRSNEFKPLFDNNNARVTLMTLAVPGAGNTVKINSDDYKPMLEAVKKDLNSLTYEQWLYTRLSNLGYSLELECSVDYDPADKAVLKEYSDTSFDSYNSIPLNKYFTHTIDYINSIKNKYNIKAANYDNYNFANISVSEHTDYNNSFNLSLDDSKNISALLTKCTDINYTNPSPEKNDNVYTVNISLFNTKPNDYDDDNFEENLVVTRYYNELPDEIKAIIK